MLSSRRNFSILRPFIPNPRPLNLRRRCLVLCMLLLAPSVQAESIYAGQLQAGWSYNVAFVPPAGWDREAGADFIAYNLRGVPIGACSFLFPALERVTGSEGDTTAFDAWYQNATRLGEVLNQVPTSWGTSTSGNTTWWMRGAELRMPNGSPVTVLAYMGQATSLRQKGVYQCVGIGGAGTQYSGLNAQVLPAAIAALKGLAIETRRVGNSSITRSQCMSECGHLASEFQHDCRLSCMRNYQ
jgi:hypothetical protein